jgi:hypothetical protein
VPPCGPDLYYITNGREFQEADSAIFTEVFPFVLTNIKLYDRIML